MPGYIVLDKSQSEDTENNLLKIIVKIFIIFISKNVDY